VGAACVLLPLAVMPNNYSLMHPLEMMLILWALACQLRGRYALALVCAVAAVFTKPSMAYVLGLMLLVFGVGSMCLAAPFILVQTNLKRLLAYSSLEHVGLICVGFGLNSRVTIWGALLHMGYHALTKPVLFLAAGNIHQYCHTLQMRLIGPGMVKVLPVTAVCMGLAAAAATGLPPFGLFFSEMTILNGGFAAGHWIVSTIVLLALLGAFCGILYQLTRILLGEPRVTRTSDARPLDGVPAMGLMLGALLVFSVWLPAPLLFVMQRAAGIIGGEPAQ